MSKRSWLKIAGFWVTFLVLHYAYDWAPILPFQIFSGVDESMFQHMKIGFYAYFLVVIIEYLISRKQLPVSLDAFVFSQLLATILVPWFMFILWFMAPAYFGKFPTVFLEIFHANVIVVLLGFCTTVVEQSFETMRYSAMLKGIIVALFLISISLYTIFTFQPPWHDVFVDPMV